MCGYVNQISITVTKNSDITNFSGGNTYFGSCFSFSLWSSLIWAFGKADHGSEYVAEESNSPHDSQEAKREREREREERTMVPICPPRALPQ
jgi:hypothetical protein